MIRETFDTLVVTGIGGSYLGARQQLKQLTDYCTKGPEIIFGSYFFSDLNSANSNT